MSANEDNMADLIESDTHFTSEQMLTYVSGGFPLDERERVERHLSQCDQCLEVFIAALEAGTGTGTGEDSQHTEAYGDGTEQMELPDMMKLEDFVIAQLVMEEEKQSQKIARTKSVRRRYWLQHPVAQYVIAASITLLLFGSGMFAGFSAKLEQLDSKSGSIPPYEAISEPHDEQRQSWSDKMMNRAGSLLDELQAARFE